MPEAKTQPTTDSVPAFLDAIADERQRADCRELTELMTAVTGEPPVLWGNIVGFGTYRYVYASGRTGDWPLTAFSPRKGKTTIYTLVGCDGEEELLARLGTHACGKSCLYVKRLADLDRAVLTELIARSVAALRERYPS